MRYVVNAAPLTAENANQPMFLQFIQVILINGLIGIFGATFSSSDELLVSTSEKVDRLEEAILKLQTNLISIDRKISDITSKQRGSIRGSRLSRIN